MESKAGFFRGSIDVGETFTKYMHPSNVRITLGSDNHRIPRDPPILQNDLNYVFGSKLHVTTQTFQGKHNGNNLS